MHRGPRSVCVKLLGCSQYKALTQNARGRLWLTRAMLKFKNLSHAAAPQTDVV